MISVAILLWVGIVVFLWVGIVAGVWALVTAGRERHPEVSQAAPNE